MFVFCFVFSFKLLFYKLLGKGDSNIILIPKFKAESYLELWAASKN